MRGSASSGAPDTGTISTSSTSGTAASMMGISSSSGSMNVAMTSSSGSDGIGSTGAFAGSTSSIGAAGSAASGMLSEGASSTAAGTGSAGGISTGASATGGSPRASRSDSVRSRGSEMLPPDVSQAAMNNGTSISRTKNALFITPYLPYIYQQNPMVARGFFQNTRTEITLEEADTPSWSRTACPLR